MFKADYKFVRKVLELSADHDPEGWPVIKMKELMEAAEAIKSLSHIVELDCKDWAETHSYIEKHYLKHFSTPEDHMTINDMVDRLMSLISAPNPERSADARERVDSTTAVVGRSDATGCWAAFKFWGEITMENAWLEFEEAPMDGTVILAVTSDRRHCRYIYYRFVDGDYEGAWVHEISRTPIKWDPEYFILPPCSLPNTGLSAQQPLPVSAGASDARQPQ